jgi:hypothetical protein
MSARKGALWRKLIIWKDRSTWMPPMAEWLEPYLVDGALDELKVHGELDLCWDDPDWLGFLQEFLDGDVDIVAEELGAELRTASVRMFHGCRVLDAGDYHREGLLRNNPKKLEAHLRRMVETEDDFAIFRPHIDKFIDDAKDIRGRDKGRLFLGLDDQALVDDCGHYALYGSEWIMCVLGFAGHSSLRKRGTPTILEVDFPGKWMSQNTRTELARKLLQEFTHVTVNDRPWIPSIDFSVVSRRDVPAELVVGHSHPAEIKDYHHGGVTRLSTSTTCPHCSGN